MPCHEHCLCIGSGTLDTLSSKPIDNDITRFLLFFVHSYQPGWVSEAKGAICSCRLPVLPLTLTPHLCESCGVQRDELKLQALDLLTPPPPAPLLGQQHLQLAATVYQPADQPAASPLYVPVAPQACVCLCSFINIRKGACPPAGLHIHPQADFQGCIYRRAILYYQGQIKTWPTSTTVSL